MIEYTLTDLFITIQKHWKSMLKAVFIVGPIVLACTLLRLRTYEIKAMVKIPTEFEEKKIPKLPSGIADITAQISNLGADEQGLNIQIFDYLTFKYIDMAHPRIRLRNKLAYRFMKLFNYDEKTLKKYRKYGIRNSVEDIKLTASGSYIEIFIKSESLEDAKKYFVEEVFDDLKIKFGPELKLSYDTHVGRLNILKEEANIAKRELSKIEATRREIGSSFEGDIQRLKLQEYIYKSTRQQYNIEVLLTKEHELSIEYIHPTDFRPSDLSPILITIAFSIFTFISALTFFAFYDIFKKIENFQSRNKKHTSIVKQFGKSA